MTLRTFERNGVTSDRNGVASAAERGRAFRERQRRGKTQFTIELTHVERKALLTGGYLEADDYFDYAKVVTAIEAALSDKLESLT